MKKIYSTQPNVPDLSRVVKGLEEIWASGWLTNHGPKVQQFETEIATALGLRGKSLLFNNGHNALVSLLANVTEESGEVITTPFTFASTIHAIVQAGHTPVFADINAHDFNLSIDRVRECVTSRTKAILPVHVFGNPCDVYGFDRLSKELDIPVIYDAAHAFGVTVDSVSIGDFGFASMFSLHATKVFHSVEGGLVCTSKDDFSARLARYRNFGLEGSEIHPGTNGKMSELHALIGLENLRILNEQIACRKRIASIYDESLSGVKSIQRPLPFTSITRNYAYYPLLVSSSSREKIIDKLDKEGIVARKYFYPLCSDIVGYNCIKPFDLKVSQAVSSGCFVLPLHSSLEDSTAHQISDIVLRSVK